MKKFIFELLVFIKYFLFIISILGILVLAHRTNLVQANVHCTLHLHLHKRGAFVQGKSNNLIEFDEEEKIYIVNVRKTEQFYFYRLFV